MNTIKEVSMLNQVIIVGRLVRDPEVRLTNDGKRVANVTIAVNRNYKNNEGRYETDFINCTLWEGIAQATCDHCQKGSIIGVKGHIIMRQLELENRKISYPDLIAETVTFISRNKNTTLQISDNNAKIE